MSMSLAIIFKFLRGVFYKDFIIPINGSKMISEDHFFRIIHWLKLQF